MIRKWFAFALTAGVLVSVGTGISLSSAADDESPLEKIMEKVNKHSSNIKKGTRNAVFFKKSQKDVEKSAKELVKLGKEAKPIKDALKKAKDVAEPQKKWDELIEAMIKSSGKLGDYAAKPDATYDATKKAAGELNKTCTDCHNVFRVDEAAF